QARARIIVLSWVKVVVVNHRCASAKISAGSPDAHGTRYYYFIEEADIFIHVDIKSAFVGGGSDSFGQEADKFDFKLIARCSIHPKAPVAVGDCSSGGSLDLDSCSRKR